MLNWKRISSLEIFKELRFKDDARFEFEQDGRGNTDSVLAASLGGKPISVTAATVTVTEQAHAGRVVYMDRAAGITATLPAATGTGNTYNFFVGTTFTGSGVIQVANATDIIQGVLGVASDAAGVNIPTGATDDTITMNGTTTGGVIGSWVQLQDVQSGVFSVRGALVSSGVEATPFSAAV